MPAPCSLPQRVRDCPRSGIKRKTIDRERDRTRCVGKERRKRMRKKEDEVANRRSKNRKKERNKRPRNSLGSLPSGLVLARSCPFTTFSFFRVFFFFLLSYCRFKYSFEQGTAAAMFFLERVYTYCLVCVQATFACSDRKREKKEKRE